MLMARDDAERAAHHFDVAFRSARSLPVRQTTLGLSAVFLSLSLSLSLSVLWISSSNCDVMA
jgi:hypothetical protein